MSDDNLPIGKALPNWQPRLAPSPIVLSGHFCRLEPLHSHHANPLFAAFNEAEDGRDWLSGCTFLPGRLPMRPLIVTMCNALPEKTTRCILR